MRTIGETLFWKIIEDFWERTETSSRTGTLRANLLAGRVSSPGTAMAPFVAEMKAALRLELPKAELPAFAEMWDKLVYALDSDALATHLGVGDDGFADARHFVVAMGRLHFEAVMKDPKAALVGGECERLGYIVEVYEERFGGERPRSRWNTSTGSNLAGWPAKRARLEAETRATVAADDLWAQFGFGGDERSVSGMVTIGGISKTELEGAILRVAARLKQRRTGSSA